LLNESVRALGKAHLRATVDEDRGAHQQLNDLLAIRKTERFELSDV
jgi:hypothetical protein